MGDFDGDGLNDFRISSGFEDSDFGGDGEVDLVYGRVGGLPGVSDLRSDFDVRFRGALLQQNLGQASGGVGFDGDGAVGFLVLRGWSRLAVFGSTWMLHGGFWVGGASLVDSDGVFDFDHWCPI